MKETKIRLAYFFHKGLIAQEIKRSLESEYFDIDTIKEMVLDIIKEIKPD